ncbi:MAG: YicC family protein [Verrucomicrobiaceae bacterium TMED137]|nr:MAG: YicC family protein [Verrucomicrobiaceae bacterium TMED137]HAE19552.1 YicC family protein [Verrucomicrobiales bacterium]
MQSMTGFGRAEHADDGLIARVEIATVNRKQADIHFSLPRELTALEADLRKLVLRFISRGRANISIHLERVSGCDDSFSVDPDRARALETAFNKISDLIGRPVALEASDFIKAPGVLTFSNSVWDVNEAEKAIHPALEASLKNLVQMRKAEGADLKTDFLKRLNTLETHASVIGKATSNVVERQRELLHNRLREAEIEIDLNDERLLKEIALFADRCDISEETTRLASHINRFREYLDSSEPVGRSLDFLCQEINREFNTIGSKANDAGIGQSVVGAKTELEKIREQVQNIE